MHQRRHNSHTTMVDTIDKVKALRKQVHRKPTVEIELAVQPVSWQSSPEISSTSCRDAKSRGNHNR
jgi:hypothetical protein